MRPWALWLIQHNCRWVVFAALILVQVPLTVPVVLWGALMELYSEARRDWRAIKNQPRKEPQ